MKRVLTLALFATLNTFALERKELMPLIEQASTKREAAYVEMRNKIVEYGTDVLPLLADLAVDESLPWQQRLVARICYERIERKEDIENLLATDWYKHPNFDPNWGLVIMGPEGGIIANLVMPEIRRLGLWYYCIEEMWKMTGEKWKHLHRADLLEWSCVSFVKDTPEERIWFLRVCSDLMTLPPPPPPRFNWPRSTLFQQEKPDSAYVLEHRAPPPVTEEPPFRLGTNIIKRAKQP